MYSERHHTMTKLHMQFTKCVFTALVALKALLLLGRTFLSTVQSGLQRIWWRLNHSLRKSLFLRLSTFRYGTCFLLLKQAVRRTQTMLSSAILSVQFSLEPWLVRVKVTSWRWWKRSSAAMRDVYTDMTRVSTPRNLMKRLQDR